MKNKIIKYSKLVLSILYVFYVTVIILNVVFPLRDVHNSIIESSGAWGYIITYGLNLLMAGGFFVGSTFVQLIVYYFNKKSVSKGLVPLIIFEVIKILGNSIYIYLIDFANIQYGGVRTAFIILGIILFVITVALEVTMMTIMTVNEKKLKSGE